MIKESYVKVFVGESDNQEYNMKLASADYIVVVNKDRILNFDNINGTILMSDYGEILISDII